MAKLNLKKLRQSISEQTIPGKFVRARNLAVSTLILTQLNDGCYEIVVHQEGEGYHTQTIVAQNLNYEDAVNIYIKHPFYL